MSKFLAIISQNENFISYSKSSGANSFVSNNLLCSYSLRVPENSIKGTFLHNASECNFYVSGFAIREINNQYCRLNISDWIEILSEKKFDEIKKFSGSFALIADYTDEVVFINDIMSARPLYFFQSKDALYISTSLNELIKLGVKVQIDYYKLASTLLIGHQFTYSSPYLNIIKWSSGIFKISKTNFNIHETNHTYFPDFKNENIDLSSVTSNLLNAARTDAQKISLALSGGLDSRFLLAVLLNNNFDFECNILNESNHPDCRIARKICKKYGLKYVDLSPDEFDFNKSHNDLTEFVVYNQLTCPASEYPIKRFYPIPGQNNYLITDGSWGEIGRRGLYNKLLFYFGKKLFDTHIEHLYPKLIASFGNTMLDTQNGFFRKEVSEYFIKSSKEQIQNIFAEYKQYTSYSIEFAIDLLAQRIKFPNFTCYEQTRLDERVFSFSPFPQKFFFDASLSLKLEQKINSNFYKDYICRTQKSLSKIKLAKNNITIPFNLNTYNSKILAAIKQKIGLSYKEKNRANLLLSAKEYFYDIVNSQSFDNTGLYNKNNVIENLNKYYKGSKQNEVALDRLLTFEIFREKLEGN